MVVVAANPAKDAKVANIARREPWRTWRCWAVRRLFRARDRARPRRQATVRPMRLVGRMSRTCWPDVRAEAATIVDSLHGTLRDNRL
jgi:hypothetical protein